MLISSKTITEGNQRLYFTYGADDERVMTELVELDGSNETTLLKKYFFGLYEQESEGAAQRHIHYIMAGDGLTAIVVEENAERNTYFTYKDHLGSIVAITGEEGDVFFEQSFDAWGRYRNADDWSYTDISEPPTWLRGYTGHEHLKQFDLINMNGRMYDPSIGRMLRPDNFVQEPTNSQSYNRYSYVFNNPLKYADPNGEIAFAPILLGMAYGALIGAGTSALIYSVTTAVSGNEWNWNSFGRATAMGAVGGALGGGGGASRSKTTTNTTTDTQTSTKINSVTSGVNIFEKETLFIPAKSGRFFLEYYISESVYETREMKKTDFKGITFSESTSPIVFGNRISYSVKGSNKSIMLSHNFYVSEIRNYMKKDITEMVSDPNAVDPKRAPKIEYYKDNSPNKFFIKY